MDCGDSKKRSSKDTTIRVTAYMLGHTLGQYPICRIHAERLHPTSWSRSHAEEVEQSISLAVSQSSLYNQRPRQSLYTHRYGPFATRAYKSSDYISPDARAALTVANPRLVAVVHLHSRSSSFNRATVHQRPCHLGPQQHPTPSSSLPHTSQTKPAVTTRDSARAPSPTGMPCSDSASMPTSGPPRLVT